MNTPANFMQYLEAGAVAAFIVLIATTVTTSLTTAPNALTEVDEARKQRALSSMTIYKPSTGRHLTSDEVHSLLDSLEQQFRYGAEIGDLSTAVETSIWYDLQTRGLRHMFLNFGQCQTAVCRAEFINESRVGVEAVLAQLQRTVITSGDTLLQARTDANGRQRILFYFPAPGEGSLVVAKRQKTP